MRHTSRASLVGVALVGVAATFLVAPAATAAPAPTTSDGHLLLAPFYSVLDLTGDEQVTTADLDVAAGWLGRTSTDAGWAEASVIDLDHDDKITVADLAGLSQRMIYDDGPFTLVEATTVDMQAAMNAGVLTSVKLTQDYLDRIAAYDRVKVDPAGNGRPLNSIITTSTVALDAARAADAERAAHGMTSMLLGIPIVLKDTNHTRVLCTTGGCGCWNNNQTTADAAMVTGLRSAGAVILAKASLDEFAYGFVSEFSSFQNPGSSLLVASPYSTSRTAGGSSGGTGAAISANLAAIGFGTDTGGSIRVPSTYNQLVGVRPTVGLTSRDGIIPLALSQDTGGPLARTVTDAAIALDAVTGVDPADPATSAQVGLVPDSYTSYLDADSLEGVRIGYVASMVGSNATTVRLWNNALDVLRSKGATIVPIASTSQFSAVLNESSGSTNEFTHDLNTYIATHLAPGVAARTLNDIITGGNYVTSRRSTYVQRAAISEQTYQDWAGPTGTHTVALATGKTYVTQLMADNNLSAMIYPSGNPYGTQGTNMRLSPNTGLPAVTVPMGQASSTESIPGAGVNLEFVGPAFTEGPLLGLAYAFEQATHARTTPALYGALTTTPAP